MTVTNLRVKVLRQPIIRAKFIPWLPATIVGRTGISVERDGLNYLLDLDYSKFFELNAFTPADKLIAIQDRDGVWNTTSIETLRHQIGADNPNLVAISGAATAADKLGWWSDTAQYSLTDFTAYMRSLLDDPDASTARATLGLVIGTDVQPHDAELDALAGLVSAADRLPYFTGPGAAALTVLTSFARSLLDDVDAATARTTLGLVIGTDVQAHDGDLDAIAALTPADNDFIQRKSGVWVNRSIAQVKTDLAISNVDNTSDLDKPISTATQSALNAKADSADLATVATTGAYGDLSGKPTLGTAASTNATDYATAAQGAKADTALQSVVAGANVTIDNTDPRNPIISSSGGGGGGGTEIFPTVALAAIYSPATAPPFITTAFYDNDQVAGSSALYRNNGGTSGDIVITLDDGVTNVGYDLIEPHANPAMFGAKADGVTNDTAAFVAARNVYAGGKGTIVSTGHSVVGELQLTEQCVKAEKLTRASGADAILYLGSHFGWHFRKIEGAHFEGATDATDLDNSGTGVKFYNGGTDDELSGRWELDRNYFWYFDKAIHKPTGNIGNVFNQTSVIHCNYGFYAEPSTSPLMQPGCDVFNGGEYAYCTKAAFYIDGGDGSVPNGQTVWNQCVIETNPGFGVFVKNYSQAWTPLTFNQVWFESNGTGGSVTMPDGLSYTPRDVYLEAVPNAVFNGCSIWNVEFKNSAVLMDSCHFTDVTAITNTNSVARATNAHTNSLRGQPVLIESYINAERAAGGLADTVLMPHRVNKVFDPNGGTVALAANHDGASGTFSGTGSYAWTGSQYGTVFETGAQFTLPSTETAIIGNFSVSSGTVAVYFATLLHISGPMPSFQFTGTGTLCGNMAPLLTESLKWFTVGGIAPVGTSLTDQGLYIVNPGGGDTVLRVGPVQVITFATMAEAVEFYNSRSLVAR